MLPPLFRRWRWITRSESPSGSHSEYSSRQFRCHTLSISILRNILVFLSNNNLKRRSESSAVMMADPCVFLSLHWLRQEIEQWTVATLAFSSGCFFLSLICVSVSGTHPEDTCWVLSHGWRTLKGISVTTTTPPVVQTPFSLISTQHLPCDRCLYSSWPSTCLTLLL